MSDDPGRHLIVHAAPPALLRRAMARPAPRSSMGPVVLAAAAALVVGIGIGTQLVGPDPEPPAERAGPPVLTAANDLEQPVAVRLVLHAPDAQTVTVAGSWNAWDPNADPLRASPGGLWHGTVVLPRGQHEYMFVLDGSRWVTDTTAQMWRDDGFGHRNAVLEL